MESNSTSSMRIGIDEVPKKPYQWLLYAIQHVLALFTANTLISIIIFNGYNMVPAALISAGIGTIFYLLITRFRSPIFLGSSAGLITVMAGAFGILGTTHNYMAIIVGLTIVGIVYITVGLIISKFGTTWLMRMLPPYITGPVIVVIGLSLAVFAVNWSEYNVIAVSDSSPSSLVGLLVALFTMIVTACISHYAKGTLSTIPYLLGILSGYVLALILHLIGSITGNSALCLIDFSAFTNIKWLPEFGIQNAIANIDQFSVKQILPLIVLAVPVSFVTICEHIGDHLNVSSITSRNLLADPGLGKTLMGDGVGTILGGFIGGMGNTTYGENSAVIAVSKVASSRVIGVGACLAIVLGFCPHLMAFIRSIPLCIFGGISLIIYGAIAVSGLKQIQKVDLMNNKNLIIISTVLVAGIGGLFINIGSFKFSGVALAMVIGVVLNLILRDFKKTKPIA